MTEMSSAQEVDQPPDWLTRFFNESVMGFLALVALATALGPLVFDVTADVERLLTGIEWVLVTAFAAEFLVQGSAAGFSKSWRRSPWRIVDVITVLGPVVSLLPQVSDVARGSIMLRMLRVVRAVAFGTRAGSVAARKQRNGERRVPTGGPSVTVLKEGAGQPVDSDWSSFLKWTADPGDAWFHAVNIDHARFRELAETAGMPRKDVDEFLSDDGHATLRDHGRYATLLLQIPTVDERGVHDVRRDRLVAIITDRGLLTATEGSVDLQGAAAEWLNAPSALKFSRKVACGILAMTQDHYDQVAQRFEGEVRRLEAETGDASLLRETFELRREISTVALDLWHVTAIVSRLANGNEKLRGTDLENDKQLDELLREAESAHKRFDESKEELKTLIELHTNFKSFEMNYFLKLLAVISALGLIPTVVGGLFGMNLIGNPWSVTLGQVAFGVAMGMATALYVFAVKGWLK